ncbi:Uncharacterized protein FKW44_016986, partial [Caligus rogercresseyi]
LVAAISSTKPWRLLCPPQEEDDNGIEEPSAGFVNFRLPRTNMFNVNPLYS